MLQNKKSQNAMMVIVAAVIGLIIIVVVVMMLTGKLSSFSKGAESASSCKTVCGALGADNGYPAEKKDCVDHETTRREIVAGSYSDVDADKQQVCCCRWG